MILHLFRPFVSSDDDDSSSHQLPSNATKPEAIFDASITQIRHLMVLFCTRYDTWRVISYWHPAPLAVANAMLKDTSYPHWRFYFWYSIYAFTGLSDRFPLFEMVVKGLVAMAVCKRVITRQEAVTAIQDMEGKIRAHREAYEINGQGILVDLDLAMKDKEAANIETLVDQFEETQMFRDYTQHLGSEALSEKEKST
ncbi:MAG: hypothetical protein Q9191_007561 [Dirinaria sp. TL-2023a]